MDIEDLPLMLAFVLFCFVLFFEEIVRNKFDLKF